MLMFKCCNCEGIAFADQNVWLFHLASKLHQKKTITKYGGLYLGIPRRNQKAHLEDTTYVIVGDFGSEKLYELAIWCSQFGVVTGLLHYPKEGCVAATIQGVGTGFCPIKGPTGPGMDRVESVKKQTSFQGFKIEVFNLKEMSYAEWLSKKETKSKSSADASFDGLLTHEGLESQDDDKATAKPDEVVTKNEVPVVEEETDGTINYMDYAMFWRF